MSAHRGWSKADLTTLGPLLLAEAPPPPPDAALRAFAQQALVYAMSGTPVVVCCEPDALLDQVRFFQMAEHLFLALPAPLRLTFSLGWNVAARLCSRLTLSCAYARPMDAAVYDPTRGTWTDPSQVWPLHGQGPVPFRESWLTPGVTWSEVHQREGSALEAGGAVEGCEHLPPLVAGEGPLDLAASVVRTRMRRPGLDVRQSRLAAEATRWLLDGEGAEVSLDDIKSDSMSGEVIQLAKELLLGTRDEGPAGVYRALLLLRGGDAGAGSSGGRARLGQLSLSPGEVNLLLAWPSGGRWRAPVEDLEGLLDAIQRLPEHILGVLMMPPREAHMVALWTRCVEANLKCIGASLPVPGLIQAVHCGASLIQGEHFTTWLEDHVVRLVVPYLKPRSRAGPAPTERLILASLQDRTLAEALLCAFDPYGSPSEAHIPLLRGLSSSDASCLTAWRERLVWDRASHGVNGDHLWEWVVALHSAGLTATCPLSLALLGEAPADSDVVEAFSFAVERAVELPDLREPLARYARKRWDILMGLWSRAGTDSGWRALIRSWPGLQAKVLAGCEDGKAEPDDIWPSQLQFEAVPALLVSVDGLVQMEAFDQQAARHLLSLLFLKPGNNTAALGLALYQAVRGGRYARVAGGVPGEKVLAQVIHLAEVSLPVVWSDVRCADEARFLFRCGLQPPRKQVGDIVLRLMDDPALRSLDQRCGYFQERGRIMDGAVVKILTSRAMGLRYGDELWHDRFSCTPIALAFTEVPIDKQPEITEESLSRLASSGRNIAVLAVYLAQNGKYVQHQEVERRWITPELDRLDLTPWRSALQSGWTTLEHQRRLLRPSWRDHLVRGSIAAMWVLAACVAWLWREDMQGPYMVPIGLLSLVALVLATFALQLLDEQRRPLSLQLSVYGEDHAAQLFEHPRGEFHLELSDDWARVFKAWFALAARER